MQPFIVPASFPIQLDTSSLGVFIPGLVRTYGDGQPMALNLTVPTSPVFQITDTLLEIKLGLNIGFEVNTGGYQ